MLKKKLVVSVLGSFLALSCRDAPQPPSLYNTEYNHDVHITVVRGAAGARSETNEVPPSLIGAGGQPPIVPNASGGASTGGMAGSLPPPQPDIALRDIFFYQVVQIPAFQDGEEVAPSARVAPLVADRSAVAKIYPTYPEDWEPQEVTAEMLIEYGGELHAYTETKTMNGPVDSAVPEEFFLVELPEDVVKFSARYSVSLTRTGGEEISARFPSAGTVALAPEETGSLRVHLLPFEVDGFVPDTSDPILEGYEDALYAVYPVTDVELTVGATVQDFAGAPLTEDVFDEIAYRVGQLQEEQLGPSPSIYYYGMVSGAASRDEYCGACPTGTSEDGIGSDVPPRAYFATGAAFGDQKSEDTLIHEIGHTHRLAHAPCGNPSNQDAAYPYASGLIAHEGYDVRTGEFIPGTHADMMGYCFPRWISDYNYRKLADWVQISQTW